MTVLSDKKPLGIMLGLEAVAIVLLAGLRIYYARIDKHRQKLLAQLTEEERIAEAAKPAEKSLLWSYAL